MFVGCFFPDVWTLGLSLYCWLVQVAIVNPIVGPVIFADRETMFFSCVCVTSRYCKPLDSLPTL